MSPDSRVGPALPSAPAARVQRRSLRRLAVSSAAMVAGATVLCVWVTLIRDRDVKSVFMTATDHYSLRLQRYWDQARCLPSELPSHAGTPERVALEEYASAETRFFAEHAGRTGTPVIVGYTQMAQLFASYNGRGVISLEGGRFRAEWVREGNFHRMLTQQKAAIEQALERARSVRVVLPE